MRTTCLGSGAVQHKKFVQNSLFNTKGENWTYKCAYCLVNSKAEQARAKPTAGNNILKTIA